MPEFALEFEITRRYKVYVEADDEEAAELMVNKVWKRQDPEDYISQDDPIVCDVNEV